MLLHLYACVSDQLAHELMVKDEFAIAKTNCLLVSVALLLLLVSLCCAIFHRVFSKDNNSTKMLETLRYSVLKYTDFINSIVYLFKTDFIVRHF